MKLDAQEKPESANSILINDGIVTALTEDDEPQKLILDRRSRRLWGWHSLSVSYNFRAAPRDSV
jgi:hypothetical protein